MTPPGPEEKGEGREEDNEERGREVMRLGMSELLLFLCVLGPGIYFAMKRGTKKSK
jgi:hypothetical protein